VTGACSTEDAYETYAGGYARRLEPLLFGMAGRLAELVGASASRCILDLATGTGIGARAVASRGARVVGVDRSPGMVATARRLSAELDFLVADAEALPFGPDTFDNVICGLSFSHFTDPARALQEVVRVLRPQGLLVSSAWGAGSSFPTDPVNALLDRYGSPSASAALDEATWSDPDRGTALLRRAALVDVSVERASFTGSFANAHEAVAWWAAWPLTASRLSRLDRANQERLLTEAQQALDVEDLSWRFAFNFYLARAPRSP
jgi:SAM-dependent methyltransferase